MKHLILGFSLLLCGAVACKNESADMDEQVSVKPMRSTEFDQQFLKLITAYDSVHNRLVNWDSAGAKAAARPVLTALEAVNFEEAHTDSVAGATITKIADGMKAELNAFQEEASLEEMRRSFFSISESLYNLAQQTKFRAVKVYQLKCPMAFNDNEVATWVSLKPEVMNPYLGTKHPRYKGSMLECGEVADSTSALGQ